MKWIETIKEYAREKPKIKKAIGILLIFVGLVALITPFTPGSWLIFIGLELLGFRILLSDKLRFWKKK
ncbi:MAG: PGPGW domain-containing protein [Deltaproteobacteria bacterium]|nr:PGPGW domain-containing protein [Deltaproteobacteria bacterium]